MNSQYRIGRLLMIGSAALLILSILVSAVCER